MNDRQAPRLRYGENGYGEPVSGDSRRTIATYDRNIKPILEVLFEELTDMEGNFVEIGSGTGQHISRFAAEFPQFQYWPTDYIAANLASINAWAKFQGTDNIQPAIQLDASNSEWTDNFSADAFDVLFCANVIHISPWAVARGLFAGAGRYLKPGGKLILYGPYRIDGKHTAPSNAEFEKWLKSLDPENGVRDIRELSQLASEYGLEKVAFHRVPANNFMPVFVKN